MAEDVLSFYDALALHYHLIFDDWDRAIARQGRVLAALLAAHAPRHPLKILDCACGIGTQAIALAQLGHAVVASDLSPAEVHRARREAALRSLTIPVHVSDMTSLAEVRESAFDLVVALDNALPHLSPTELHQAAHAIASRLKPGGLFLASIRDYDSLGTDRPTTQPAAFFGDPGTRRIVHQVWDWTAPDAFLVHLYITAQAGPGWTTHHFVSPYRLLLREELSTTLHAAGFPEVHWLMPHQTGFYQPLVLARLAP